ncbi:hypothetical protein DFH08DRAFT_1072039 [Mycena albidolilacea]|uniref:Fungal-type protein kinase domain-containing protein n=1 Tax=Mycena albidolilacea TaxID=1033008 RepID=A0AAD7AR95_9AGAR|nr:hypothetical protein DFH08DRAFT_1072039 [Mycena albidolilacea]
MPALQMKTRSHLKQLEALELYEKTASDERDAMARSILPGEEPPSASLSAPSSDPPPVVPSASFSQLLPTDSEAIKYPNKTLISVAATGVIGSLTTSERKEQRSEDAQYCARHFAGHVVLSPLNVVLARMGTSALVDKLEELKKAAHAQIDATLENAVLANFSKESISSSTPVDRRIDDRYWLARLADAALKPAADGSLLVLDYFPTPAEKLPEQKRHGYMKKRKYDASLRPSAANGSTISNIFVNVEFTNTDPPNVTSNPLIGATQNVGKYQQAITNADALLTFQPTRLSVPTLSFHGKGKNTKLFVSILSCDRFEFAVIDDCFDSDNFPTVSALLHLFRIASLYQLGYNPLFIYNFISPPPGFSVGDAVPSYVVLPAAQGAVKVRLSGKCLSQLRLTPFQRSTVVLEGELDEPDGKGSTHVVVKMSFIANGRLWREKIIVDALHTADVQPAPAYAPKILAAFAARASPPPSLPNDSEILQQKRKRPASALEDLPAIVPRHLEIMAFDSPPNARKLAYTSSAANFLAVSEDLFRAILDAFRRRVLHRDISVNNILVADNMLLLVDWEIGRRFQEPSSAAGRGTVTGTLDTMSVASLANDDPLPHDDIESAVYVVLKVLTQTFVPPVDQERKWAKTLNNYFWDNSDVTPETLRDLRILLWTRNLKKSTADTTMQIFRSAGDATRAQLVLSLLSLPLPDQRDLIDSSDYDAVLSSLEGLVEQAVAAVRSVDASSLILSSA